MKWVLMLAVGLAVVLSTVASADQQEVTSPDGRVRLTLGLTDEGAPVYRIDYGGQPVLIESQLGLALKDEPGFLSGLKITGVERGRHDETWNPMAAERSPIRDNYNWLTVSLETVQGRELQLIIRAYDEGAGFRYTLPEQEGLTEFTITNEATEFHFDGNLPCWPVHYAQGEYKSGFRISDVKKDCERPLTVQIPGGPCVAVGEAAMQDYFRMRLQPSDRPYALKVFPNGVVTATVPFSTPWRFVLIGDTPGQLLERNYLLLNLNDPCAIKDTSWIKPGKVIRDTTLSTAGGKACIDFAAKMGLQFIEYDAGWYGNQYDPAADARSVSLPPGHAALDIQEVVAYGARQGIGVILYVNHLALENQADELYPLYQQWGVKGVKFGFVNVGPQRWAKWITDNLRNCAEHELLVDIHDEYRPTGLRRTWPNLMTAEGVGGDETWPPAEHLVTLPFTRALCGPFDNTVCMFNGQLTSPTLRARGNGPPRDVRKSRAFQLAKAVIVFSPLQFLYWYDRPSAYGGEPELELWRTIPTVWDETRAVHGAIGKYVTLARRSGREWYVGSANAGQRRSSRIPLSFLEPGTEYTADIYSEGVPGSRHAADLIKVTIERKSVDANTVIEADMSDIGGHAMRIAPVPAGDSVVNSVIFTR